MPILTLKEVRDIYIQTVLEANDFNRTQTARDLGVSAKTIFNWLAEISENNGDIRKHLNDNRVKYKIVEPDDVYEVIGMATNEERINHANSPHLRYFNKG